MYRVLRRSLNTSNRQRNPDRKIIWNDLSRSEQDGILHRIHKKWAIISIIGAAGYACHQGSKSIEEFYAAEEIKAEKLKASQTDESKLTNRKSSANTDSYFEQLNKARSQDDSAKSFLQQKWELVSDKISTSIPNLKNQSTSTVRKPMPVNVSAVIENMTSFQDVDINRSPKPDDVIKTMFPESIIHFSIIGLLACGITFRRTQVTFGMIKEIKRNTASSEFKQSLANFFQIFRTKAYPQAMKVREPYGTVSRQSMRSFYDTFSHQTTAGLIFNIVYFTAVSYYLEIYLCDKRQRFLSEQEHRMKIFSVACAVVFSNNLVRTFFKPERLLGLTNFTNTWLLSHLIFNKENRGLDATASAEREEGEENGHDDIGFMVIEKTSGMQDAFSKLSSLVQLPDFTSDTQSLEKTFLLAAGFVFIISGSSIRLSNRSLKTAQLTARQVQNILHQKRAHTALVGLTLAPLLVVGLNRSYSLGQDMAMKKRIELRSEISELAIVEKNL